MPSTVRVAIGLKVPTMKSFSSTRASMYLYNTVDEIDQLVAGLEKAVGIFS